MVAWLFAVVLMGVEIVDYRTTVDNYFSPILRNADLPHENRGEKSENKLPGRGGFSPEMTSREKSRHPAKGTGRRREEVLRGENVPPKDDGRAEN